MDEVAAIQAAYEKGIASAEAEVEAIRKTATPVLLELAKKGLNDNSVTWRTTVILLWRRCGESGCAVRRTG